MKTIEIQVENSLIPKYIVKDSTLAEAYKPYDIVTDKNGNVGFIREVSVNSDQDEPEWQISYAITWLVAEDNYAVAWYYQNDLIKYGNIFIKIAENSCIDSEGSHNYVEKLMSIQDVSTKVKTVFPKKFDARKDL